jgi:Tol biopolymer transport system component
MKTRSARTLSLICVLLIITVLSISCSAKEPEPVTPTDTLAPTATPVLTCGTVEQAPYIGKIAYASNHDGDYEICVMEAGTTETKQLTNNDTEDRYPAWSPDGQQLVYVSKEDGVFKLYLMDADGGNRELLYEVPDQNIYEPEWSNTGDKIVMCVGQREEAPRTCRITILDLNGRETAQPYDADFAVCPEWSPDDSQIAFIGTADNLPTIFVMNNDGNGAAPLEQDHQLEEYCPHWMPVGLASEMLKNFGVSDPIIAYTAYIPGETLHYFYFITNKGEHRNSVNITVPGSTEITDFSPDGLHVLMEVLDNPTELSRDIYFIEMEFNKFNKAVPLTSSPNIDETDASWSMK